MAEGPAHCNSIEASEAKPWYEDIKNLLRTGQYPPFADRRDRKTLRRLAIHYFLSGEILYRRSFDSTLLWCIDKHESRRLMEEVHGGNCGPHMNEVFSGGAVILSDMDGTENALPVNADAIKKYYP
ncbi:hypothetical protein CRG98_032431 [Punica granatum]|uniref:Uncharacterized protein n=1 Tax=Punica granatum TaxID=22663 RepID=A0A2I0IUS3_PUNGR|nr:hypothetical protein CRG98_032431 [Punica granatum]